MGLGFKAQVFIPPVGMDTWAANHDRQELVLDADYGGFCAGPVAGIGPEIVRFIFPAWGQALSFVQSRTPFTVQPDAWPIVFGPDYLRAYASNSAEMFLLVEPRTNAVVGYITLARGHD